MGQCGMAAGCLRVQVVGSLSEECGTPEAAPRELEAAVTSSLSPHCPHPVVLEALRGMSLWWRNFLGCLFVCLFIFMYMDVSHIYVCIPCLEVRRLVSEVRIPCVFGGQKMSLRG